MTQVQTMTDSELNRALAEKMGNKIGRRVDYGFKPEYDRDVIALPNDRYKFIPDYCTDPAASLEVQTAAISKDAEKYVRNLAIIKWGDAVDPEEVADWPCINVQAVGDLLNATPRERAEAAYITITGYKDLNQQ